MAMSDPVSEDTTVTRSCVRHGEYLGSTCWRCVGGGTTNTDVLTSRDLTQEMIRLSRQLDSDHANLVRMSSVWAHSENAYRMAKAKAYLKSTGTVEARKAAVDLDCERERIECHETEALKQAALERVRSTRAQLSALQSIANAVKSEADLAGRFE